MRRSATLIAAAAVLGLPALAYAQISPAPGEPHHSNTQPPASSQPSEPPERSSPAPAGKEVPPGQPAPDPETASAAPEAQGATQRSHLAQLVPSDMSAT
ncbi:MAG TPA: hypothetical protein VGG67_00140, partial [Steroidobacteraceae bacterium]